MAELDFNADSVTIKLSLSEKIFGASSDITIPAGNILGAYKEANLLRLNWGLRFGASFIGLFYIGRFFTAQGTIFSAWTVGHEALTINLSGNGYRQVIIGVTDAQALADDINERITAC